MRCQTVSHSSPHFCVKLKIYPLVKEDERQLLAESAIAVWCVRTPHFRILVEQRIIFRQTNHISPHFTLMIFSILKQNSIISLKLLVKAYWNSLTKEERNLFLNKIKELQEIQNMWRNMVTWRNMVIHSIH